MAFLDLTIPGEDVLETGTSTVDRKEIENFQEKFDQFVIHYVEDKLMEEIIVRLENGFPTTDREADAFDRQKEKNDQLFEKYVREKLAGQIMDVKL